MIDQITQAQATLRKAREELDALWVQVRGEFGGDAVDLPVFNVVVQLTELRDQLECLVAEEYNRQGDALDQTDPQRMTVADWPQDGATSARSESDSA